MSSYVVSVKINANASSFNSAINSALSKSASLGSGLQTLGGGMQSLGKKLMPVAVGVTAVGAGAVKTAIDFTKLYESAMVTFTSMLGGEKNAQALYNSLLDVAKGSTYSQETFLKNGQALVGMGVSAKKTESYLQAMTDSAMASGKGADAIDQMTTAFSKAMGSGKMNMEVMNSIADNGVQGLKILGNQYGVTAEEMQKMISSGAVPAEEALDKLTEGMQKGTDGVNGMTKATEGMGKAMKGGTLTGAIDGINSAIRSFSLNLVGINPTLTKADEGYEESAQRIKQLTAVFSTIGEILPNVAKLFGGVTRGVGSFLDKLIGANVKLDESTGKWTNVGGVLGKMKTALETLPTGTLEKIGNAFAGIVALAPALLIGGKAISGIGGSISFLTGAIGTIGGATANATGGMKMLGSAMKFAFSPMGIVIMAVAGALLYLYTTNEQFRTSVNTLLGTIMGLVGQLLGALMPVITTIVGAIGNILTALAPALVVIINVISSVISALVPIIVGIVGVVARVISGIISIISPIITFIATVISAVVTVIGGIIKRVSQIFTSVKNVIVNAFTWVYNKVKPIIDKIASVFGKVKDAVGTVKDGIQNAFTTLVNTIKGIINKFIGGINGAVSLINKIPGVSISKIPQLRHGTKDWAGGFAYMNEGGRGELVHLPNGSTVVPHDLSKTYARESAHINAKNDGILKHLAVKNLVDGSSLKPVNSIDNMINTDKIAGAILGMSGALQEGMAQALENMSVEMNSRPLGRFVRKV